MTAAPARVAIRKSRGTSRSGHRSGFGCTNGGTYRGLHALANRTIQTNPLFLDIQDDWMCKHRNWVNCEKLPIGSPTLPGRLHMGLPWR